MTRKQIASDLLSSHDWVKLLLREVGVVACTIEWMD